MYSSVENPDVFIPKFKDKDQIRDYFEANSERLLGYVIKANISPRLCISGDALILLSKLSGTTPKRDGVVMRHIPRKSFFQANKFSNMNEMINRCNPPAHLLNMSVRRSHWSI